MSVRVSMCSMFSCLAPRSGRVSVIKEFWFVNVHFTSALDSLRGRDRFSCLDEFMLLLYL